MIMAFQKNLTVDVFYGTWKIVRKFRRETPEALRDYLPEIKIEERVGRGRVLVEGWQKLTLGKEMRELEPRKA
jgi:hypothetical protein